MMDAGERSNGEVPLSRVGQDKKKNTTWRRKGSTWLRNQVQLRGVAKSRPDNIGEVWGEKRERVQSRKQPAKERAMPPSSIKKRPRPFRVTANSTLPRDEPALG